MNEDEIIGILIVVGVVLYNLFKKLFVKVKENRETIKIGFKRLVFWGSLVGLLIGCVLGNQTAQFILMGIIVISILNGIP